ncbi:MAG: DVU_1551 family NTP transferase [Bacillota bacterium]
MRGAAGRLAALVLAAGFSSRMGSFKPLLPLGEATVIERAVGNFFAAGIQDVRVVVGHRAEEVIPVLKGMGVQIILNREYAGGMFSSVKVGVNTFKSGIKAFFLLPGDHPLIKPHTLWEIIGAYHENRAGIIYPCFNGERGHPPLISADYINKILAWNRQGGLRSLLNRYNADALDLEVADQGVLLDMDNPVDYQNMIEKSNLEEIPNEAECFVLLTKFNVPRQIVNHSVAVAQLAEKICMALNAAGCRLNLDLIKAAGLLHDLAKGIPDHARVGASLLQEMGYPKVAEIVAVHMDIAWESDNSMSESKVLYLADKLVKEDRLIALEVRFQEARAMYAEEPAILDAVTGRFKKTLRIKEQIENIIALPLETVINKSC